MGLPFGGPLADRTGCKAAALFVTYAAPAAVTAAPVEDIFDVPKVAANFADGGYTYPISTPAAAWASAAAYHDSGADDPATAGRIKDACDRHRLSGEWDRLKAAAARPAPAEGRYALPAAKKYPLDTAAQVKAACAYLPPHADRLSGAERVEYAANVLKAAADLKVDLAPDGLYRLEAEAGLSRPADGWRNELTTRAGLAKLAGDADLVGLFEKAAAGPSADHVGAFRNPAELAELLRSVDRRMGWSLPDPLLGVSGDTPSSAAAKLAGAVKAASGNWYLLDDLDRVPDAPLVELFGLPPVLSKEAKAALLADPGRGAAAEAVVAGYAEPAERAPRRRLDWDKWAGSSPAIARATSSGV